MGACTSRGKSSRRIDVKDIDFSKAGHPLFAFNGFNAKSLSMSRRAFAEELPNQFCAVSLDGRRLFVSEFQSHFVHVFDLCEIEQSSSPRIIPDTENLLKADGAPQRSASPSQPLLSYRPAFVIGGRGVGDGRLHYPTGVAINETLGHLIVCDHSNHRLQAWAVKPNPNVARFWFKFGAKAPDSGLGEKSEVSHPYGVAVHPVTGDIFACDSGNNRVLHFDQSGKFFKVIGGRGRTPGKFEFPYGVVVCGSDLQFLAVSDFDLNRVQLFDIGSGEFVREFGSGNLKNPKSITVDYLTEIIYVADSGNHRIVGFRLDGTLVLSFGGSGEDLGQFSCPSGIAVDHFNRRLVVCDTANFRVQVLTLAEPKDPQSTKDSCFTCFPHDSPTTFHNNGYPFNREGGLVFSESDNAEATQPAAGGSPIHARVSIHDDGPICVSPKFSVDLLPGDGSPQPLLD